MATFPRQSVRRLDLITHPGQRTRKVQSPSGRRGVPVWGVVEQQEARDSDDSEGSETDASEGLCPEVRVADGELGGEVIGGGL